VKIIVRIEVSKIVLKNINFTSTECSVFFLSNDIKIAFFKLLFSTYNLLKYYEIVNTIFKNMNVKKEI